MSADLFQALEDVCTTGANRVLTSGGEQECLQGIPTIAKLVRAAHGRISIMAGGRIGIRDAAPIVEQTGVTEIHVGLATPVNSKIPSNSRRLSLGKGQGLEFQRTQVMEESVHALIESISSLAAAKMK
jgi:copper homeostasis protein